jgi:hypothetical protein
MSGRDADRLLLDLIEAVYEAGIDPTQWQRIADIFRDLVPGGGFSCIVGRTGAV